MAEERVTFRRIDTIPGHLLDSMLQPHKPAVVEAPKPPERPRGLFARLFGVRGEQEAALARESAARHELELQGQRAKELSVRRQRITAAPFKIGVFHGGKMIGFASAWRGEKIHESQPEVLRVDGIHVEGQDPRVGMNLVRHMTASAADMTMDVLRIPDIPPWLEGALRAEKARIEKTGRSPNLVRGIHIDTQDLADGKFSGRLEVGRRARPHAR